MQRLDGRSYHTTPFSHFNVVPSHPDIQMSQPDARPHPVVDSTTVFKPDIFKNKVLFCTGGGSGICRIMTEAVVRESSSM
jgi:hypothetical protein